MSTIEDSASVNAPTLAMRSYLSTHMLWGSGHFARLAKAIEASLNRMRKFDIQQRAYTVGAVLAAVGFAEAAINEFFQDVADGHLSYTEKIGENARTAMTAYWRESQGRGSILEKYQIALGLAGRLPFSPGAEPFQSFALLIKLRNMLVHFRPETASAGEIQGIEKQLASKFDENPLMAGSGNPYFPNKCLGAECANWAVSVAKALVDDAFTRLGVQPNYQCVSWDDHGNWIPQAIPKAIPEAISPAIPPGDPDGIGCCFTSTRP